MTPFPEWLKILITALVSFTAATALDVLKDWKARRKILGIIADEVNSLAIQMSLFLAIRKNHTPTNALTQKPTFDTERYDYFYDKNRDVLYQIPSWGSLKRFYDEVKKATDAATLSEDEVNRLLIEFKLLEDRIRDGLLGKRFMQVLLDKKFSQLIKLAR